MKRTVLLDLDGTLIDSAADLAEAVNHLIVEHGLLPYEVAAVRAMTGDGASSLIARAFEERGSSAPVGAVEHFRAYYAEHCCAHTRPYPGIPELLERLVAARPRPAVSIVTNKPHTIAERIVDGLALARSVDDVVGPEVVDRKKPDPDHLRVALERLGASPENAVMVGDGDTDVRAGQAAGLLTVAVAWGFRSAENLRALQPDHLVSTVAELGEILLG